jgi:hypothetical protein
MPSNLILFARHEGVVTSAGAVRTYVASRSEHRDRPGIWELTLAELLPREDDVEPGLRRAAIDWVAPAVANDVT